MPALPDAAGFAYDVFISYSSKDAVWVRGELLSRLEAYGFRVCLDRRDFVPGAPSVTEMERAVETSRHTLLVLTPSYLQSGWTEFESLMLQTRDPANQQRSLIPLLKEPCEVPLRVRYLTAVDFTDPHDQDWSRLFGALGPPSVPLLDSLDPGVIPLSIAPLPSGSRMPLSPNPLFVGRQDDLRSLAGTLKTGGTAAIGQIAAATGLGGIGKTQLACEFVHRYGQFFAGGVFWLSFADPGAVPAEVAACGGATHLDLRPDFDTLPIDQQVQLVKAAWESPIPRLLVFDNCEDEKLLHTWRPKHGGCRVLITSRRPEWDPALGVRALHLEVLPRAESVRLLRKFREDLPADDPDLDAIADALGDLPLALHLAGSFLQKYRRVVTPVQYLARLSTPTILDDRSLREAGISPTEHIQHVARTFEQSYERLDATDPTDALALTLLARAPYFAAGEPLPPWLLVLTLDLPEDDPDAELQAEDALNRLIELGLLEIEDEDALRLHRLVAAFARAIATDTEAQTAVEQTMIQVANYFNQKGDLRPLLLVQPHLRHITNAAQQREDELAAKLCSGFGSHLHLIGDYAGARAYHERSLAIDERVLGPEHQSTATSLNNLGELLRAQGDLEGARAYHEWALAIWERVLGSEHQNTVTSLNNLGLVLQAQGDLAGAREYFERALAIWERVLGLDHPNTATSLNNLGLVLREQGDLEGARKYSERALAIRERVLGLDHPNTATSLNNLGLVLREQGDLEGARKYYERALVIFEQRLSLDHPNAQLIRNNLADLDAQSQTAEQQIAEIEQKAEAAVAYVLARGSAEKQEALVAQLEYMAQWAEDDQAEGSLYLELAQRLRALAARLRAEVAVAQALVEGSAEERTALAERIAVAATTYAAGQPEDSAWVTLAQRLWALAARLREAE
jgi:tetratricopeptide (TPR) repeat protein